MLLLDTLTIHSKSEDLFELSFSHERSWSIKVFFVFSRDKSGKVKQRYLSVAKKISH